MGNNKSAIATFIIFMVGLIVIVLLSQRLMSKNNELNSFKQSIQTQQTINKIESNKEVVRIKEVENKELTKKINSLNNQLNSINNKLDNLNLEELKYEIQKSDINSVSNRFTQLGYSSSVISY